MRQVRGAGTSAELATTLAQLFTPLGPGIIIGASLPPKPPAGPRNAALVAWHYRGPGIDGITGSPYSTKRMNRSVTARTGLQSAVVQKAIARASDSLETPIAGATVEIELSTGLKARVALSLTDLEARTELPTLAAMRSSLTEVSLFGGRDDVDVRLADVVVAWNALRHFSPYWSDVDINWDARLRPQLDIALHAAATREAHLDLLRLLVADLNDGHGNVFDGETQPRIAVLPVQFRILAGQLVVTASRNAAVPVGSVVTTLNGLPASTQIVRAMQLASGSPQWKRVRAESALRVCQVDAGVTLTIEPPTGAVRDAMLPCISSVPRLIESRPDSITELEPGIWYVDLTRVQAAQLQPMLAALAAARGVVFDMRGYPTEVGFAVLPYLMRGRENANDRWMHVPRFAGPFGQVAAWEDGSWNLEPATPHITAQRIFLTDGRAISYAESVMGYVRDYKLGTIIGGATAGANGNVAGFDVPGGFSISFTGMRVTGHDGETPLHTTGIAPDIRLEPTLAGIRAGRDELLARALATLRNQR